MDSLSKEHVSLGLHLWRANRHLSMREVAEVLGLTKEAISLKESGQSVRVDQLVRLDGRWPGAADEIIQRARALAGLSSVTAVARRPTPAPKTEPEPKSAPTDTFLHRLLNEMFEGHPLALFEWKGTLYFIAKQVGAILGYANDGHKMVEQFATVWVDEVLDKRHRVTFTGQELSEIKATLAMIPESIGIVGARSNSLTVLTEEGLYRVLELTNKPIGQRLRDKVSGEVLPSIRRTGSYTDPSVEEQPAAVPVATAPVTVDLTTDRAREMRLLAKDIRRKGLAAEMIDQLHVRAAALLLAEPHAPTPVPVAVAEAVQPASVAPERPARKIVVQPGNPKPEPRGNEMDRFVQAWWDAKGDDLVQPKDLLILADQIGVFARHLISPGAKGRAMQLGSRVLSKHVDKVIGDYRIIKQKSGKLGYRLVQARAQPLRAV